MEFSTEDIKYIVIELQKNTDGTISNTAWTFDDRNQAESKYYSVLSYAAVSNLPKHSVTLLHEEGYIIRYESYSHGVQDGNQSPEQLVEP